jgi:hypothetical protein
MGAECSWQQKERERGADTDTDTNTIPYLPRMERRKQTYFILKGWHVDFMLRACCRGVGGVRDEENHWRHPTYLESHSPSNIKAKGGGGGEDGGGRV